MRHYALFLYRIAFICLTLLTYTVNTAGQTIDESINPIYTTEEIIYAIANEEGSIRLQDDGAGNSLDGYIRWFTEDKQGKKGTVGLTSTLKKYDNGYAWYNNGNEVTRESHNVIKFRFNQKQIDDGIVIVCDASSTIASEANGKLIPQTVSIRHRYIVKDATIRAKELAEKKKAFDGLIPNIKGSIIDLINSHNRSRYVLHDYEIHTPNQYGTNYHLPERLNNYYLPNSSIFGNTITPAVNSRWVFYDENGNYIEERTIANNLIGYKFENIKENKRNKRYILTFVKSGRYNNWYPVSFLDITLEPFSEHLTQKELEYPIYKSDPNYNDRYVDDLVKNGKYELLSPIDFDNDPMEDPYNTLTQEGKKYLNISSDPFEEIGSFYAFAAPLEFNNKKGKRVSIGRGEYALFRTLNYKGISRYGESFTYNGNTGKYNDYFANTNSEYNSYDKKVVDRLWEKTGGRRSGYFMYLDAADEPGVIARIPIKDLCSNTSLIVTAWVCDLAHGIQGLHADIGFTFKSKDTKTGEEKILMKYYTGAISNKPDGFDTFPVEEQKQAEWQQVSFKFSFSKNTITDGDYILEISNNCNGSNGADYGIDDICVYRSLPDIDVQRKNACESSTLEISSDYETIQRNMGWDINADVLSAVDENVLKNIHYRKFRYGLMGPTLETDLNKLKSYLRYLGNIYYGFVKELVQDASNHDVWITLSKQIAGLAPVAKARSKSLRVVVPSDLAKFESTGVEDGVQVKLPTTLKDALKTEYKLNIRAIRDFVQDVYIGNWKNETGKYSVDKESEIYKKLYDALYRENGLWDSNNTSNGYYEDGKTVGAANVNGILADKSGELAKLYEESVVRLFAFLQIPRIRCPWIVNDMMYLDALDVKNTDLHFAGEKYTDEQGNTQTYDGKYYVVMFNSDNILDSYDQQSSINLKDPCTLISPFYVMPSTTITVETKTEDNLIACAGTIQSVDANLMVTPIDEFGNITGQKLESFDLVFGEGKYTFDWFLGSEDDLKRICGELQIAETTLPELKELMKKLRDGFTNDKFRKEINSGDINRSNLTLDEKRLLNRLIGDGGAELMLTSGKGKINFRFVESVYVMPYIPDMPITNEGQGADGRYWSFCADGEVIQLTNNANVPSLNIGFPEIAYPHDFDLNRVPLRLGLNNINSRLSLTMPILKDIQLGIMADGEKHILKEITGNNKVYLNVTGYPEVGTLDNLFAEENGNSNSLTIRFNNNAAKYFEEGKTYSLSIPYGEYRVNGNGTYSPINNSCEGRANLVVKIVPEYLTWKGGRDDVWDNDNNWNQSTEAELYKGAKGEMVDANGSDDITNAFAPLYFTKITIPDNMVLKLSESITAGATENIQYDMAVNNTGIDNAIEIVPYYVNRVEDIYFKPKAKLVNQHYLNYSKAWVELEMENNGKRWFASPIDNVYAGDFYAPKATGREESEAFKNIKYDAANGTNSRWTPAFYQKAWNSAVNYAISEDGANKGTLAAVKSNWSIEYNDVSVPYPIGKGFYLSVENVPNNNNALVRLPKSDTHYSYEQAPATKSAGNMTVTQRDKPGRMAELIAGHYTLRLDGVVYGDGKHLLVGNPFMCNLNMDEFFKENSKVLAPKFWRLSNGTVSATVVGTPDIPFENGAANGTVEPMEAFFVELADNVTVDANTAINFTPAMMSATESINGGATTKGTTATNPLITITAERGDMKSVATLSTSDRANNEYRAKEDAIVLLDSELAAPMVYTIAGSSAAQVNSVKSISNIGLGLYNNSREEVAITISGLSRMASKLYLYDANTGKSIKMDSDSYRMTISGDSHGRYYLRDSEPGSDLDNAISIYSAQRGRVIVSAIHPVKQIKAFSLNGAQVRGFAINSTQYSFDLPAGIYMIYASDGETEKTEKVIVK